MGITKADAANAIYQAAPEDEQGSLVAFVDGLSDDITRDWLITDRQANNIIVDFIRQKRIDRGGEGNLCIRCRAAAAVNGGMDASFTASACSPSDSASLNK